MAKADMEIISRVKQYRQQAGLSQSQLASMVGLKRQAIYDVESGRYLPNTVVALRLAKALDCRVEDLFMEASCQESQAVVMAEQGAGPAARVSLAKVRGRLVGYPVDGAHSFHDQLRPADGILQDGGRVELFCEQAQCERTVLLTGCDPAFSLLAAHVARADPKLRVMCRFASSHKALDRLAAGMAHIAGTHLHSAPGQEANVRLARQKLGRGGGTVVGYSLMEEGLMVARGNPAGIKSVADLAKENVRFVNREAGAALRHLLDDELDRAGIPASALTGYNLEVTNHSQGAHMVLCGAADASLGMRAVASAHGLDFVPISEVRCDLVIPADLTQNAAVQTVLDVIQSRRLRDEIALLPGYSPSQTGRSIAAF